MFFNTDVFADSYSKTAGTRGDQANLISVIPASSNKMPNQTASAASAAQPILGNITR
ncbi:hypothetical protein BN1221_01024 [Brenneria goodwinii]|uniref:Uncharacterized protein n=1 Tax=Brenneria goodwinii TaxID=1109412 RepID=A0A0G4JRR2_9GAMM|nr:hypothetical protein BN1221_01024 [Brenneria goodwinii]